MASEHDRLLDATIGYLEELKARGVRFVPVSAEALGPINAQAPAAAARPQSAVASAPASLATSARSPRTAPSPRTRPPSALAPRPSHLGPGSVSPASDKSPGAGETPALLLPSDSPTPMAAALSPEAKAAAFAELRQQALACKKCARLAASRKSVVFGVGDINAQLMFIGEAPGADEDEQGEPFVGKAGQLLTRVIETMGLTRASVYIANILKCRPDTPGQTTGNRKPTPQEMQTCIPYLHQQIDLIRPKVLVALGGTAAEGLVGRTVFITKMRGQWHSYRGIPLMLTYHPSYLLRNQAPAERRRLWEDMLAVMQRLAMPISEKQRNYFRK